jgi:Secretion system C-terminal sorting domain
LNSADTKGASLQQNQPNPFSQATIIRYAIPQGANAEIKVYDAAGRLVKNMKATESGQAQINAYDLSAGTYTYTLIVDGKVAASKKNGAIKMMEYTR